MPRGDRTGPDGMGPMTGRGMGFCAGFDTPGFMNPCYGRGFRRRAGAMQVMPSQFQPQVVITEKQEKQYLEQELEALKQEMNEVEKRLKEMKK